MVIILSFLAVGVIVLILVLKFDKKQTTKVNTVLRETRGIPPLFMLKLTEQKISTLKAALRYEDVPQNMGAAASMANIYNNDNRQSKVHQLKVLSSRYNNGQISLETYNVKLDELLEQVQSQGNSFELAS
jgi:hypothetical protein